jgi:hypothetical protein
MQLPYGAGYSTRVSVVLSLQGALRQAQDKLLPQVGKPSAFPDLTGRAAIERVVLAGQGDQVGVAGSVDSKHSSHSVLPLRV